MKYGNCWLWARLEFWRRERAWIRAGRPKGAEPYWCKRRSRKDPRWVWHYFVGGLDPRTGHVTVRSFKPIDPTDAPLWMVWTHTWFLGVVVDGDTHVEPES